jgi:serine/threonine protein kinase/Tol biopolymer transport system component
VTPERWAQIEDLFHREAECESEHRGAILEEACSQDPELRREVEALLSGDTKVAGGRMPNLIFSELSALVFPLSGHTVSHYRILGGLAGGGMGFLYRAEDLRLGRRVALKFLPEESIGNPLALKRFEREARVASALEHPNICPVYEFGEHEQRPFIVMPLLEGQTLADLIYAGHRKGERFEPGRIFDLALQIAHGLEAAHRQGIVHRDIKPANIFITTEGQAKILDFGLAKLANPVEPEHEPDGKNACHVSGKLALSRTGAAIGTVGYMSPEQVRGERVDLRTDLFSFGLVLYEMATEQRAFAGDTAAVLHHAILHQTPPPVRSLNPRIPGKLEAIINRAIQKDAGSRYQTASEMRLDLEELAQVRYARRWVIAAASVAVVSFLAAAVWLVKARPQPPKSSLEVRFQQLTTNAPENRVLMGAISPDGKYLAYSDLTGMHVKLMQTGETRSIPQPAELMEKGVDWEVTANWLPNGTQFVANAHEPGYIAETWTSKVSSVWLASVLGGTPKKLRDEAMAYGISPDGSHISFGTKKRGVFESEIWLMNTDGTHAEKFLEAEAGGSLCCLLWSPRGERILYIRLDLTGAGTLVSRAVEGGPLATIFPPEEMKELYEFFWLRDGRVIYSVPEPGAIGDTCNYWIRQIDLKTGARMDEPRRLTNWSGFCPAGGSATADGKKIALQGSASHVSVYVADLQRNGSKIANARQFTLDESNNDPVDWTPDRKSLIFVSNRGGKEGIFKQSLDQDTPQLLAASETPRLLTSPLPSPAGGALHNARVTPDSKWVLWFEEVKLAGGNEVARLMRVPLEGGPPEPILTSERTSLVLCARPPSSVCAIAERSGDPKEIVVTSLDPIGGRGPELVRYNLDDMDFWSSDISPDGTRLAAITGPDEPILILDLAKHEKLLIPAAQLHEKELVSWAADGRSLFVTHGVKGGSELVHMDLQGRFRSLWKNNGGGSPRGLASPDGRHLAIRSSTKSGNMWMMENF